MHADTPSSFPLTRAQRGLWVGSKLQVDKMLMLSEALELFGPLDPTLLLQANRQITREFDVLRLCIHEQNGLPEQIVLPEYPGELQYLDFSDEPAPRAAAERWVGDQLGKRENLRDGPLWFCVVFRLGQDHHLWVQYTSHLVMDGFTGTMLAQRLASLYNAYAFGQEPEPAAYGSVLELVTLEQEYRASDRYRRDREYWMQQLSNLPPAVTLAKPGEQNSAGLLRATGEFSPETVLRLRALGAAHGASLPQTLIALVAAYYHRYTGAEDLVMAMPVTGRVGARYRQVPGLAANAIYLRLTMRPNQPFHALFPHVSSVVRHGLRHQQYRVEDVRRDLGMFANMQRIARLAVNIEAFDYGLRFGEAQAVPHNLCNGLADDLTIFCYERGNGMALRFDLDANPALYDREELAEHCRRLSLLADAILDAPERPLALLDILGTQERCRLLWECNATAMPLPIMATLPHQLLERYASMPAGIVVQCDERTLDDAQVCELAARIAARWIADGIKPGDVIAVALPRSEQLLLVLLAVMWSGAAYLPLDPDGPLVRNRHMLDDAAAIGLVCEPVLRDTLLLDGMVWLDPCPADLPAPIAPLATPEGTAYVLYTSGSTGIPKGVEISHRSLLNFLFAMRHDLGLRPRDRMLAVTTVTFDIAGLELYLPLLVGARVVIAQGAITHDPRGLARLIAQAQVSVIQATPSLWRILLANDDLPLDKVHALVGGEALGAELATRLLARVGRLTQLYGPTESTIWSTIMPLQLTDAPHPPIGRPIANTRVYVLDPQQQLLPTGAVGELYIGGAGVAKGYRGKPQLTSERFVCDPFVGDGSRMYRTGDQVRLRPDGVLEFIGRIDDQLKIRGHRIEPREIENALQQHPQVAQAVVVGHRDHDGTMQLLAYVVALPEQSVEVDALRQYLQACLPSAMLPSRWMSLPALPLTATGKLDRKALPVPDAPPPREHVPPRDPIEQQLAAMVEDILGINGIGVHDSFFELGVDSLGAAQMAARFPQMFGIELPLVTLLNEPTIAGVAEVIRRNAQLHSDPLASALTLREGEVGTPALFCIHPVMGMSWSYATLLSQLDPRWPVVLLQSPGLADSSYRPDSIEAIAHDYLARMRSVQPHGPYRLVGWSLGGLIAHAIAAELRAAGELVELLALLDSYPLPPQDAQADDMISIPAALRVLDVELAPGTPLPTTMAELAKVLCDHYGLLSFPLARQLLEQQHDLVLNIGELIQHHLHLACHHRPSAIDVDVLFVEATRRPDIGMDATDLIDHRPQVWQELVRSLRVEAFDTDHYGILSLAHVGRLAKLLQASVALPTRGSVLDSGSTPTPTPTPTSDGVAEYA
ncbi:non-ribosomal peptide synthetase [Xanthomonas albilineans]|uniref:non-ribosomal peptide synthetase n=1 Tax=Xanthomonas albilineans TaxID=29447 RepID=UPI0005F307D1|nr:non-ribosomal peptide synthetase [Xanthomonas albilineans]